VPQFKSIARMFDYDKELAAMKLRNVQGLAAAHGKGFQHNESATCAMSFVASAERYLLIFVIFLLFINNYLLFLWKNKRSEIMSTRNNFIFIGLHVAAWVIFIGLCIEAGALLVNFAFSIYNPDVVHNLYQKLDLSEMYSRSKWAYFGMYSFILFVAVLKAYLFYIVAMLMHKIDLSKPFNNYVSEQITKISYCTFSIGILSYIARQTAKNLQHHNYDINNLNQFWADSQAFILMAAVIYVIATIFKKGVELQTENDLTV
jgi:hypothetical protein